jgi:hypothetical protein
MSKLFATSKQSDRALSKSATQALTLITLETE